MISPLSPENDIPETDPPVGNRAVGGATARQRSRRRKAIYVVAIIALIVVLFAMGYPGTVDTPEKKGRKGGWLAQYRDENRLSQTELGEIDPMSETVRLGTLGMRGVGSSLLWWTATQFQMKKDWTQLRATLDQISKLQPHSIAVWRYQAWNLSYNVSVAFDDYHDKFYWVIEGLNYMLEGVRLNDKEPRLYWDMGWFISNKIGRADEAKYYRRLFAGKKDTSETAADFRRSASDDAGKDFSPDYVKDFRERAIPPTGFPHGADVRDNWHFGKAWFLASESKIDPPRYPVRGMADVIFYSDAPTTQFYYADNLEKDGRFDQVAVNAWKQATREWNSFGDMAIDTSYDMKLQLNRQEEMEATVAGDLKKLDEMVPGEREKLRKEKLEQLKKDHPDTWAAWNTPEEKRTAQQSQLVYDVTDRMEVKNDEVARRASKEKRSDALKLAAKIDSDKTITQYIKNERSKVNFDFWRTRADAESSEECIAARKAIHDGDEAFAKGDQIRALPLYEKGMRGWRKVLDGHPSLVADPSLGGDLLDVIHNYQKCLGQDDRDLPKDFPLQDIIKAHERGGGAEANAANYSLLRAPCSPLAPMPRRNFHWLIAISVMSGICYLYVPGSRYSRVLAESLDLVTRRYYRPVSDLELFENAMKGMAPDRDLREVLKTPLDEHSHYISPADKPEFDNDLNQELVGIGILQAQDPKTKALLVLSPVPDGPAVAAGVRAGDRIVKIDGQSTKGMSLKDSSARIKGQAGTSVTITVEHPHAAQPADITIVRRLFHEETVEGASRGPEGRWNFLLPGKSRIGYVRITAFTDADGGDKSTAADFRAALEQLQKDKVRGLVLDLRDNGGGSLRAAIEICDMLVPGGEIVTTRGRDGRVMRAYAASGQARFSDFPIAVLVNGYSASASEIVAACLQDNGRAIVAGQRSYGKGTVQEVIDLGSALGEMKFTVATYWRPSGQDINRPAEDGKNIPWGVTPNEGFAVPVTDQQRQKLLEYEQDREIAALTGEKPPPEVPDLVLQRAVEYLDGKK